MKSIDVNFLRKKFESVWGIDTSYYGTTGKVPSYGQCAVTTMIIQDMFGGDIYKIKIGKDSHYFNKINGKVVDITADQFGDIQIDYSGAVIADRTKFAPETIDRYYILRFRLENK